jgi:hypothetical protein
MEIGSAFPEHVDDMFEVRDAGVSVRLFEELGYLVTGKSFHLGFVCSEYLQCGKAVRGRTRIRQR